MQAIATPAIDKVNHFEIITSQMDKIQTKSKEWTTWSQEKSEREQDQKIIGQFYGKLSPVIQAFMNDQKGQILLLRDRVTLCDKIEQDLQIQDDLFEKRLQKHQCLTIKESKPVDESSHKYYRTMPFEILATINNWKGFTLLDTGATTSIMGSDSPVRAVMCPHAAEPARQVLPAPSTSYINELAMSEPVVATKTVLIQP
uniref:Peptidase A2 domain-containing protein n=1 Tax=Romanomermis culicivorax TaxID=13658 RepID=A0A915KCU4_ROMCU